MKKVVKIMNVLNLPLENVILRQLYSVLSGIHSIEQYTKSLSQPFPGRSRRLRDRGLSAPLQCER